MSANFLDKKLNKIFVKNFLSGGGIFAQKRGCDAAE